MSGRAEKVSTLPVSRGLFIVRYAKANDARPPYIFVRPSPGDEHVKVLWAPDAVMGRLDGPGAALVVVSDNDAHLQITARARTPGGSLEAQVQLEPIAPSARATDLAPPPVRTPRPGPASGAAALRIVAHMARRGDVSASAGEWVGGPSSPAPLEGVEIHDPEGSLEYQVQAAGGRGRWSKWVSSGVYAGTRGQARPLVGVRLRLPASAPAERLRADALFLGAPILSQSGREVTLVSASGKDPLVGLRLSVDRGTSERPGVAARSAAPRDVSDTGQADAGRVRVFR